MTRDEEMKKEKDIISTALDSLSRFDNVITNTQKKTFNFKGRKSCDIASALITELYPDGCVVCDPFMGSGSFGIAALKSDSIFYGNDLDNYTFSVVKVLFTKCSLDKIKEYFNIISDDCKQEIMDLYKTECCGVINYISKLHFDPEGTKGFENPEFFCPTKHRDIKNNETIVLSAACPICGSKHKIFENKDLKQIEYCNKLNTTQFPHHELIENSRINITKSHGANKYDRNFTNRAKYALLRLQKSISNLPESIEKELLEQCLVASLTLARICQYGSGSEYIYQVLRKQAQEKNVWEIFESKVNSFIKFKQEYSYTQLSNVTLGDEKMVLSNKDYREFLNGYLSFFDVIYTDPPYTDQVPYLERSQLYRDWLNKFSGHDYKLTDDMLKKEMVISNAPSRVKDKLDSKQYYDDIDEMFKTFYKSLKPKGRVILTVKLGSKKYLLTLAEYIKSARKNGFEYIAKYGIDKKDPTLRKQAARKNTMMNEIIIVFTKLDADLCYWYENDKDVEKYIVGNIYTEFKKNNFISMNKCVSIAQNILDKDFGLKPSSDLQKKIEKVINDNFCVDNHSLISLDTNKLYIDNENNEDLFIKLYDLIPVIIRKFDKYRGFTLEDLYFEIANSLFEGDGDSVTQIIESQHHQSQIISLLRNYCTFDEKDKYFLKEYMDEMNSHLIDISKMDGYEFEELIKKMLIALDYKNVTRIGGSGDRGVDIIATKYEGRKSTRVIFQCKRWIGKVGGTPIQRLHSYMHQYPESVQKAVCVTTSDYTSDGYNEGKSTGVELVTGKELIDELNRLFPHKYYHGALDLL